MATPEAQSKYAHLRHFLRRVQWNVPPWGVSLVFHVVLILLLVWLVPTKPHDRSAPGFRVTKNVGIVFAPVTTGSVVFGPATQQDQSDLPSGQPANSSAPVTSVAAIVSPHLAERAPGQPVTPLPVIGHSLPIPSSGFPNTNSFTSGGPSGGSGGGTGGVTSGGGTGKGGTGKGGTEKGGTEKGGTEKGGTEKGGMGGDVISGMFMGAEGMGRKFVYVLDRSASTGYGHRRSPMYVAKNELLASLQSIGDAGLRESKPIQFQVIFFNQDTAVFNTVGFGGSDPSGRLLHYDQAAFDQLQRFLGGMTPGGGTKPEPALMQAIRMGADCIFFMTDGSTQLNPSQLQRIRQTAKDVQINVVEYGMGTRPARSNSLRKLAEENHGNHVYVDLSQRSR